MLRPPELGGSGACCNRDVWLLSWFRTPWRLGRSTAAIGSERVLEAVGFFETVQSFGNLSLLA